MDVNVKMTEIRMEWTDRGAIIFTTTGGIPSNCPVCDASITPGIEHRCGEFAVPQLGRPKKKAAKKRKKEANAQ